MIDQKGNGLLLGIIIGLLIACLSFFVYYLLVLKNNSFSASNSSQVPQNKQVNPQVSALDANEQIAYGSDDLKIDINQMKVGDSFFGEMTVKSVDPYNIQFGELSEKNFKITFSGRMTLKGDYFILDGSEMGSGGKHVNFRPDDYSFNLLPREKYAGEFGYARSFIFNNYDKAVELLLPSGKNGTATVVIDNYTLVGYPSEISNSADLIETK